MTVKRSFRTPLVFSFLILLSAVLLVSVPFGLALEVHHLFSEVDHDGHEHDTHDLCTWVEHHAGGTYVQDGFFAGPTLEIRNFSCHPLHKWVYSLNLQLNGSRAPPIS